MNKALCLSQGVCVRSPLSLSLSLSLSSVPLCLGYSLSVSRFAFLLFSTLLSAVTHSLFLSVALPGSAVLLSPSPRLASQFFLFLGIAPTLPPSCVFRCGVKNFAKSQTLLGFVYASFAGPDLHVFSRLDWNMTVQYKMIGVVCEIQNNFRL